QRFREDIVNSGAFQHGTHRAAGDNTGTGSGRLQEDNACCLLALDRVRNGALNARNLESVLLRLFNTLGNSGRNFLRLAVANTNGAIPIAYHDEGGEAETTSTFYNF